MDSLIDMTVGSQRLLAMCREFLLFPTAFHSNGELLKHESALQFKDVSKLRTLFLGNIVGARPR
jgi:hypothetical protein